MFLSKSGHQWKQIMAKNVHQFYLFIVHFFFANTMYLSLEIFMGIFFQEFFNIINNTAPGTYASS